MVGVNNQAFEEEERLSQYNLHIPVDLKDKDTNVRQNNNNETSLNEETVGAKNSGCFHNITIFISKNRQSINFFRKILIHVLVLVYFTFASLHWINNKKTTCNFEWCNGYGMLLILISLTYFGMLYQVIIKKYYRLYVSRCFSSIFNSFDNIQQNMNICCSYWTIIIICIILSILFLIYDSLSSIERLISSAGVIVLTAIMWIFSKHPSRVNWRPVATGFILQFFFGLIIIRWSVGKAILKCVSEKVSKFLLFSNVGNSFVYSSELIEKKVFAFSALPVIFFMSFMVQILYYLGVMQWIIMKIGWILQTIMGTTVCESINASANVFLGMTESPILIKPYLTKLTLSEIHAIMCCGFATVSGTVMAAYISFGAEPSHLISASVMSAPASLCFAKLFYPETEKSLTSYKNLQLEKSEDTSIVDAATKGALAGIPLILGIIANLIAFISFITFFNAVLSWLGELVGYNDVTLELIMSKVFMPLAWLMGIPWNQCEDVGTLIGLKTVVNEFVAFQKLGEYKLAGKLQKRSEIIATYAICGFSNPGSIGIMIGGLSSMVPEKRAQITSVAVRAFIAGSFVCFLTACIAGMLLTDELITDRNISTAGTI